MFTCGDFELESSPHLAEMSCMDVRVEREREPVCMYMYRCIHYAYA